jgi:hypothetical protein
MVSRMHRRIELPAIGVAALTLLMAAGCDTRKSVEAPQGDTPVDTAQAPTHVRLLSDADGESTGIYAMRPALDGGYVAAGYTDNAPWIFKTDAQGSIEWQQRIDGFGEAFGGNRLNDVELAPDGGYVAAGRLADRAIVIKFRADGVIEWQWSAAYSYLEPEPPGADDRRSAEAMTIAVNPDGAGYVVAGAFGRTFRSEVQRLTGGTWMVELTADGRQGRQVLGLPPGESMVFEAGDFHGLRGDDQDGGIIEALATWSLPAVTASEDVREGFWYAGRSVDGQMLVGQAQHQMWFPRFPPTSMWKRSFGPGTFHTLKLVERDLPDGTRQQRLLLLGEAPGAILVCELQATTGELVWARQITEGGTPIGPSWSPGSIQPTADGGYILAAASPHGPAVLKLDRDGVILWQYEYLPAGPGTGFERGQAFAIHARPDGGYRVAGSQASWHSVYGTTTGPGGFRYFQVHATVFDIDADGGIVVNEKSGWTRLATSAISMAASLQALEPAGEFVSPEMTAISDAGTATLTPTTVIVETASGPDGVLSAPPVGSNDPGNSFYWGNVAGASGFIVYHSEDGIAFTRANRTQDFSIDLRGNGFYRLVSFNGAGYSDYSPVMGPMGNAPAVPQAATLTVVNSAGGGLVTSTPAGITCGTDCTESFSPGTEVVLNLVEGEYLRFSSWTGCFAYAGRQCIVHLDRDAVVTVNYTTPN